MYFKDRAEAGKKLAARLENYRNTDSVVYALPRGGVVLGVEVATALDLPLDLVIPRKIGHPFSPEYAIAAVTENGVVAVNEKEVTRVAPSWFASKLEEEKEEAQRRRAVYMTGRAQYSATNKTAILVDDGIATGLTMKAAILDVKKQHPSKIIVAIPVVPAETAEQLLRIADGLEAMRISESYLGAVGLYYSDFPQITDYEVNEMLDYVNPRKVAHI